MIWDCMSFKGLGENTTITSTIGIIPSIENWFGDDKFIFLNANTSYRRVNGIQAFILESHIK